MNCHNKSTNEETNEAPSHDEQGHGHRHSFKMTLFHMVPMIILFSFYDSFEQSGYKVLFYGLVALVVLGHGIMMVKMNKRHLNTEDTNQSHTQ